MSDHTLSERLCLQAADEAMKTLGFVHPQVLRHGEPVLVKESGLRIRGAVQYKTFHPVQPRKITVFSQVWFEGSLGKWIGGKVELCEGGSCFKEFKFEVLWPSDNRYPGSEGREPIVLLM